MKKNLIFTLMSCLMLTFLVSFTLVKKTGEAKISAKKEAKVKIIKRQFACGVVIQTLTASGSTFTWTVNTPANHYNYGGYYQAGGTFSGSTTSTSVSISSKPGGGRFNVTPVCADGSQGTPMNILF